MLMSLIFRPCGLQQGGVYNLYIFVRKWFLLPLDSGVPKARSYWEFSRLSVASEARELLSHRISGFCLMTITSVCHDIFRLVRQEGKMFWGKKLIHTVGRLPMSRSIVYRKICADLKTGYTPSPLVLILIAFCFVFFGDPEWYSSKNLLMGI